MMIGNLFLSRCFPVIAALVASALFSANPLHAAPISGQASFAGTIGISNLGLSFSSSFGSIDGATNSGSFAGLNQGSLKSLNGGIAPGSLFVPEFAVFDGGVAYPITLDLTNLIPGAGTSSGCESPVPGLLCTPVGLPLTLIQVTSTTLVASIQMQGNAFVGSQADGYSSALVTFSATVNGVLPDVFSQLQNGGTLTTLNYSGSVIAGSAAPEPRPAFLFAVFFGTFGVIAGIRRYFHPRTY